VLRLFAAGDDPAPDSDVPIGVGIVKNGARLAERWMYTPTPTRHGNEMPKRLRVPGQYLGFCYFCLVALKERAKLHTKSTTDRYPCLN
jgi:hypothetical protein